MFPPAKSYGRSRIIRFICNHDEAIPFLRLNPSALPVMEFPESFYFRCKFQVASCRSKADSVVHSLVSSSRVEECERGPFQEQTLLQHLRAAPSFDFLLWHHQQELM